MNKDKIRQAMITARSVVRTARHDTPEKLLTPERARVLERTISEISEAIDDLDRTDEPEFTNAIAGDRDRRGVYGANIASDEVVLLNSGVQMRNIADRRFRKAE